MATMASSAPQIDPQNGGAFLPHAKAFDRNTDHF